MKQLSISRQNILLSGRRSKRHPHLNPLPSRERKLDHFGSGDSLINLSTSPGHAPDASRCLEKGKKNIGLGLKIGKQTAAAILAFLCMVLPGSGSAAERKSD